MQTRLTFLETLDILTSVSVYRELDFYELSDEEIKAAGLADIKVSKAVSKFQEWIDTAVRKVKEFFGIHQEQIVHYRSISEIYKAFKEKPVFLVIAGLGIISLMLFVANAVLNAKGENTTESDLKVVRISDLWEQAADKLDDNVELVTDFSWLDKVEQNSLKLKGMRIGESDTTVVSEATLYDETGLYAAAGGFVLVSFVSLLFIIKKPANKTIAGLASILSIILAGVVIYLLIHAKAQAITFSDMAKAFGLQEDTAKKIVLVTLAAFALLVATTVTIPAIKTFFTKSFGAAGKSNISGTQVQNAITESSKVIEETRSNNPEEFNETMQKTDKVVQKTTKLALAGAGK